jgi:hypothetical protein
LVRLFCRAEPRASPRAPTSGGLPYPPKPRALESAPNRRLCASLDLRASRCLPGNREREEEEDGTPSIRLTMAAGEELRHRATAPHVRPDMGGCMCDIRLQCQGLPLEEPSFVGAGIERRGCSGGGERRGWRELRRREIQHAGAVREGGRRCLLFCSSAPGLSWVCP